MFLSQSRNTDRRRRHVDARWIAGETSEKRGKKYSGIFGKPCHTFRPMFFHLGVGTSLNITTKLSHFGRGAWAEYDVAQSFGITVLLEY